MGTAGEHDRTQGHIGAGRGLGCEEAPAFHGKYSEMSSSLSGLVVGRPGVLSLFLVLRTPILSAFSSPACPLCKRERGERVVPIAPIVCDDGSVPTGAHPSAIVAVQARVFYGEDSTTNH